MFEVQRRGDVKVRPKRLRAQGVLPMALVERSHATVMLQAPVEQVREAMRHLDGHGAMQLQIGGEATPRKAIVKHIEHDAIRRELIHLTLQEVSDDDLVKVDVPIRLIGEVNDTVSNVTLTQVLDHLKVRSRLRDMPDHIEVDISGLEAGGHLEVSAITLADGIECLTDAHATVATLSFVPIAAVSDEGSATSADGASANSGSGSAEPS